MAVVYVLHAADLAADVPSAGLLSWLLYTPHRLFSFWIGALRQVTRLFYRKRRVAMLLQCKSDIWICPSCLSSASYSTYFDASSIGYAMAALDGTGHQLASSLISRLIVKINSTMCRDWVSATEEAMDAKSKDVTPSNIYCYNKYEIQIRLWGKRRVFIPYVELPLSGRSRM